MLMKKIKLLLVALISLVPVILVGCSVENEYKVPNAYLIIDINPSIEVITDEDGLVSVVTPLNQDAEALLVDVDFTGMTVDGATKQIVELAIAMGYLDFDSEKAIIITAEAGEVTDEFTKTLAEKVEAFVAKRKMNIEVLKANFDASEDMEALAQQLNISIGKLKLITVAMANNPELTVEAGAEMSISEINQIIINARKEVRDFYKLEFHDQYQHLKEELHLRYLQDRAQLLNAIIQNMEGEAFSDLNLSAEAITEIKAIYQAYVDDLLAIDLNIFIEEASEVTDDEIDEYNQQCAAIREKILTELNNIKDNHHFSKADRKMVQARIRQFRDELNSLEKQINTHRKNNRMIKHHRMINKPFSPIKELQREYQQLLKAFDININDIEAIFSNQIAAELEIIRSEYQETLANHRQEIKNQAEIIKQQLIEEKLTLKNLWRYDK